MPENHLGSRWAPRGPMAVEEGGFAAPAIKRRTSDAQNLSESAVLVQKCRKPYEFYHFLKKLKNPKSGRAKITKKRLIFASAKVAVSLESGANFKKRAKTRFRKYTRR